MAKKAKSTAAEVIVDKLDVERACVWIIGQTPLIYHAMSQKSKQTLLFPKPRKTAADKSQSLKHDPLQEFRDCCYRRVDGDAGPTRLIFPAVSFKASMCNAALEIPGAKKTQIGRLVWVENDYIDMYGVPEMLISIVRSSDMNKTPDMRTRAILRKWACKLTINFVKPTLNQTGICRLLETAGLVMGVGDFRQQKGAGNYGQFCIADEAEVKDIVAGGGMEIQDSALESPNFYDLETSNLYNWFVEERARRGK